MNLISLVLDLLLVVMLDASIFELIRDFLCGVGSDGGGNKLDLLRIEVLGVVALLAGLEGNCCGGCFKLESIDVLPVVGDPMDHLTPFLLVSDIGEVDDGG